MATTQCIHRKDKNIMATDNNINDIYIGRVANESYEPEAATNLFEEIENAMHRLPGYHDLYSTLNRVFRKCLDLNTANVQINFGGVFPQTDYLLKEHNASPEVSRNTNDTRVRLRSASWLTDDELAEWHLYDLRNLCQFIACIYNVEIPASLQDLFPTANKRRKSRQLVGDYLRVIVERWDDDYIFATADDYGDGEKLQICYSSGNQCYNYDWSYLRDMLHERAQLNLIRPRVESGIIYPELTIVEPDYLVDITTVARCFTNYAESPVVNIINRLQPQQSSSASLLGNFAGQLLDEQLHEVQQGEQAESHTYRDSIMKFWQQNPVSILTTYMEPTFHADAQIQKQNISNAIHNVLPREVSSFDPKECMVEPSFFSEMLGLQGRMDLLQLDYKVLLEQKSGKGDYQRGDNFVKPRQKEEHYVQMLLYMALIRYNFGEIYKQNNSELRSFLLYSKYKESLLRMGFAPELIFRAIKLRNRLAWSDILLSHKDEYKKLAKLTPEMVNEKNADNTLWNKFQYASISGTLNPIRQASSLERAYYFRFLTFIANEHMLSKVGNKLKENSGFAAKWYDTLEEKLQAGNIYDRLTLISPNEETMGSIERVALRFNETTANNMSNFRTGDIVILYAYNVDEEPDARRTMVFRCSISDIGPEIIELKLRAPQSNAHVFLREAGKMWAIEHDFFESSVSSLYRGMHSFLSAPKQRRDLMLLQRRPSVDRSLTINGDYGTFNELATRVKQAKELFLIIGPPGTGKTSFGLLNALKEELTEPDSNILLIAYTNRAVDEICSKLHQEGIDFVRIGGEVSCSPEYRNKLLSVKTGGCSNITELKSVIDETRVVVSTTTSMNSNISLFTIKHFSLAIIDEASQILEPHLIGLLCARCTGAPGVPVIRKFVMIGDHKQLPAVVQQSEEESAVSEPELNEILLTDCRLSLFERLLKRYRNDREVVYMLSRQGRMHHDIALFPNYAFYNNRLREVPLAHQTGALPLCGGSDNGIDNLLTTRRIAFLHVNRPAEMLSNKVNDAEADVIAATVLRIYRLEGEYFSSTDTVGVIVPYRNQIATIRGKIDRFGIEELHDITIDTVERYQGSQRKYIIYGFTVQEYYQLSFLTNNVFEDQDGSIVDRKLNVAMTRAREHLLMVGNAELLSNNFTFHKLIEFVRSRHSFFRIPLQDYITGHFSVAPYDPVETDLSQAGYQLSDEFAAAFRELVTEPVESASAAGYPASVLGNDMYTNLNAIGYGRVNITAPLRMPDDRQLSERGQTLLYCHYFMRQRYCVAHMVYADMAEAIRSSLRLTDGRLRMVDIGCGPATSGIAFAELFLGDAAEMVYTGIDISAEMKRMGDAMLTHIFGERLKYDSAESLDSLGRNYWDEFSERPATVVINIAHLFSNVTSQFAERLARQIVELKEVYPHHRYMVVVQYPDTDSGLNAFRSFRHAMADRAAVQTDKKRAPYYTLQGARFRVSQL
jgi:hypothetical protein